MRWPQMPASRPWHGANLSGGSGSRLLIGNRSVQRIDRSLNPGKRIAGELFRGGGPEALDDGAPSGDEQVTQQGQFGGQGPRNTKRDGWIR